MNQQKEGYKIPYHYTHIQTIATNILKQMSAKYDTIMFTRRTQQIIYSILSEAQIMSCGFKKIILPIQINPYMQYEEIILVLTLSGQEDFEELDQFSRTMDYVSVLHLGICTAEAKQILKKIEFKTKNSLKGFKEENLDFFCYLHNVFVLSSRTQPKGKQKEGKIKKNKLKQLPQQKAIQRLSNYLFSYQNFSQFQFYIPKTSPNLTKTIKQCIQAKLQVLKKYNYKGLAKNQGMSSVKTRVFILQRTEQVSPFILSLYYGPLAQELRVANSCRLVSVHSNIFNEIYYMDILSANQYLLKLAQQLSASKQKQLSTINLNQAKKVLQKAYNPSMSKQQLQFHQALMIQINKFMQSNCDLLALQQSIANKVSQEGQNLKGSTIVSEVLKWCEKNQAKYDRYLGLVMLCFQVHAFWWYQRNQLIAGVSDEKDRGFIQKFLQKCKQSNKVGPLVQKPPTKDQDGCQIRQKCFRHSPPIVKQFINLQNELKQKNVVNYQILKINSAQVQSFGKKTRTVVYINGVLGYNQLSMLLALKRKDVDFVCKDLKNTRQWAEYLLYTQ